MSEYKTHEDFFKAARDQGEVSISVEELYQHFKDRMVDELLVDSPHLPQLAILKDYSKGTK